MSFYLPHKRIYQIILIKIEKTVMLSLSWLCREII